MIDDDVISIDSLFSSPHEVEVLIPAAAFNDGRNPYVESVSFSNPLICLTLFGDRRSGDPVVNCNEVITFVVIHSTKPANHDQRIILPSGTGVGFEHRLYYQGNSKELRLERLRFYSPSDQTVFQVLLSHAFAPLLQTFR